MVLFTAMTSVISILIGDCRLRNSVSGEALITAYVERSLQEEFATYSTSYILVNLLKTAPGIILKQLRRRQSSNTSLQKLVAENIQINPSLLVHFPIGPPMDKLLDRQLEQLWDLMVHDRNDYVTEAADRQLLALFRLALAPHGFSGQLQAVPSPLDTDPCSNNRLQLPAYNVALLRILTVAAANLDTRVALLADFSLKARIDRELEACYSTGELIVDECYLHLRYLRGWLAVIGGPRETPLPDLSLPGERAGHSSR
jgi:hypothetical protein